MSDIRPKVCPECATVFDCGGACWCNKYPPIMPLNTSSKGCYCEKCFHNIMVNRVSEVMADLTPEMVQKIKTLPLSKELLEDIDYSIDASGNKVFSDWYLLRNES